MSSHDERSFYEGKRFDYTSCIMSMSRSASGGGKMSFRNNLHKSVSDEITFASNAILKDLVNFVSQLQSFSFGCCKLKL